MIFAIIGGMLARVNGRGGLFFRRYGMLVMFHQAAEREFLRKNVASGRKRFAGSEGLVYRLEIAGRYLCARSVCHGLR